MTGAAATLLESTLIIEAITLIAVVVVLVTHAAWRHVSDSRRATRLAFGRPLLAHALLNDSDKQLLDWLHTQPMSLRRELCVEFAAAVHGRAAERLETIARRVGVIAHANRCCHSRRWTKRLHGTCTLTALQRTGGAMPDISRSLMIDRHPAVRAQTIEWVSLRSAAAGAALLVGRLTDRSALARFAAQDSVRYAGDAAAAPLVRFLSTHAGAARRAALVAAKGLALPSLLPTVLALTNDGCAETRALATSMLGVLGGATGTSQLQRALTDVAPEVRAAAAHAIGKLGHWSAAPSLTPLLSDVHFGVRMEAASALRRLGAPGTLLLRRAASGPLAEASDMAKHVMSLPDPVFRDAAAA